MEFIDPFDFALAKEGVPSVFTLNHEGVLQLDLIRSRDFRRQNVGPYKKGWVHCVLIDRATNWPQYALLTSPNIANKHARADIYQFSSYDECLEYVAAEKEQLYSSLDEK